ncbi:MAG TPA: 3'(2'),5'-bisphosphate nucleotidase CysQ [Casimicrobium sp.]|nr:3'(2'),5'-bisphosphate nucleotidase CysQ [Casimicrobium sp.]
MSTHLRDYAQADTSLARTLAQEAGALLLELRATGAHKDRALGDAGDAQANAFLLQRLAVLRPNDAVLSEESADDRSRLNAERVWIIDPLDGTREYREGRDDWAVHVALISRGAVIAAAVSQPSRGDVFDSSPASLPEVQQRKIVISRSRPPKFAAGIAEALNAELLTMGSAGAKALAVVRGEAIAYVHEGGLNEWDAAAPAGVALAHGLHVCDLRGRPIGFNQYDVVLHGGFVVCRPECVETILGLVS